jgi:hypothetical protein
MLQLCAVSASVNSFDVCWSIPDGRCVHSFEKVVLLELFFLLQKTGELLKTGCALASTS